MAREHPRTVRSRRHFDAMAAQYDTLFVPRLTGYAALHDVILAMLSAAPQPPQRLLELGLGTGNLASRILQQHPQSTLLGYDLSARMLEQARAKLAALGDRVQCVEADISRADFPGPFDAVVSAIAVHHVPPRAKPDLFRRLHAALKPGGVVIIGDTFRAPTPELDATYRRLRAASAAAPDPDAPAYEAFRRQAGAAGGSAAPLEHYLRWMRQAGLQAVDCVWKFFSLAVVYGERPSVT